MRGAGNALLSKAQKFQNTAKQSSRRLFRKVSATEKSVIF